MKCPHRIALVFCMNSELLSNKSARHKFIKYAFWIQNLTENFQNKSKV